MKLSFNINNKHKEYISLQTRLSFTQESFNLRSILGNLNEPDTSSLVCKHDEQWRTM